MLDRRPLLRAAGVSLALPPLEAILTSGGLFRTARGAEKPPLRVITDQARVMRQLSVLDFERGQIGALDARLGAADRQRLDEHLTGVRELERKLQAPPPEVSAHCTKPAAPASMITPDELTSPTTPARTDLMLDIIVKALQCDLVRYVAFQMENGQNFANLPWLA